MSDRVFSVDVGGVAIDVLQKHYRNGPSHLRFRPPHAFDEYDAVDLARRIAADLGRDTQECNAVGNLGSASSHIAWDIVAPSGPVPDDVMEAMARRMLFGLRVLNWSKRAGVDEAFHLGAVLELAARVGDPVVERLARQAVLSPGAGTRAQLEALRGYADEQAEAIDPSSKPSTKSAAQIAREAAISEVAKEATAQTIELAKDPKTWTALWSLATAALSVLT